MSNDDVLANQKTILDNQQTIQDNQATIKANQEAGVELAKRLATLQAEAEAAATKKGNVEVQLTAVEAAQKALDDAKAALAKAQTDEP